MSDFVINNGVLEKYTGESGNVVIPDGVTSIGKEAFSWCGITSVTIPDSVSSIGDSAFSYCINLTSITIPDSVTSIGEYAFSCCTSLRNITIPDSVTSIGEHAFGWCRSLTGITVPDGSTSIGISMFDGCSNLTYITIPDSVTSIGEYAFSGCKKLSSITIPDGVTSIGARAFSECGNLTNITIPDGVTSIGKRAFSQCGSLTSIMIPDSVTSIGDYAFSECSNLTNIAIPDSVTSIGGHAFDGCSNLTNIAIPDSVTSTGEEAMNGCSKPPKIISPQKPSKTESSKPDLTDPVVINDPAMLPNHKRPLAAIGYAENPDETDTPRKQAHLKYLKANAAKLAKESLAHPALLELILTNKLLKAEAVDSFLQEAAAQQNAEATDMLLDYQANKLTAEEKEQAVQRAETRERKVTDFIFSVEALEQLQGKVFVVTGKLTTFSSRNEFKACLDACGAILSETLNKQTAYLITNTPNSGSAKNKKAEALGVKKLTEEEFIAMIGRSVER